MVIKVRRTGKGYNVAALYTRKWKRMRKRRKLPYRDTKHRRRM